MKKVSIKTMLRKVNKLVTPKLVKCRVKGCDKKAMRGGVVCRACFKKIQSGAVKVCGVDRKTKRV